MKHLLNHIPTGDHMNRFNRLKLNLLAAAYSALSGAASANIISPTGTTEGGEMALAVFSHSANATYLFDIGIMARDFHAAATGIGVPYQFAVNLNSDSEFQAFLSKAASANDIAFSFFGGDNVGNAAASRMLMASFSEDVSEVINSQLVSYMLQMTNYITQANADPRLNLALGGGANASATLERNMFDARFLDHLPSTSSMLGGTAPVYHLARTSSHAAADALDTFVGMATVGRANNGDYWFVFGTTPETSAVPSIPEAHSVALLLAGLACAAPFLRRRTA